MEEKVKLSFINESRRVGNTNVESINMRGKNYFQRRLKAKIRIEQIYKSSSIDAIIDTGAYYSIVPHEFWSKSECEILVEDDDDKLLRNATEFGLTIIRGIGHNGPSIPCHFGKIKVALQTIHSGYRWLDIPAKLVEEGYLKDHDVILGMGYFLDTYKISLYGVYETGADKGISFIIVPDKVFIQ